jgi:hypothetical protein
MSELTREQIEAIASAVALRLLAEKGVTQARVHQLIEERVPSFILGMDPQPPGGDTQRAVLGFEADTLAWRTMPGGGTATGPVKMFSASLTGTTLEVRDGLARWADVTLVTDATDGVWTHVFTEFLGYRYGFMELDLPGHTATFSVSTDDAVPEDSPQDNLVRVPLVKVFGAGTGTAFKVTIVDVCHDGMIKLPGVMGPPVA